MSGRMRGMRKKMEEKEEVVAEARERFGVELSMVVFC